MIDNLNERMKDKVILVFFLLLFLVAYMIITLTTPESNNQRSLSRTLTEQPAGEKVYLTDLTDFDWDAAYTFAPYTSKDTICQIIGTETKLTVETYNDSMVQLIFTKDSEIVCVLLGYPDKLGYSFHYGTDSYDYLVLYAKDKPLFYTEHPHNRVLFRYLPEG